MMNSCKASTPKPESSSCTKTLASQRSANLLQMLKLVNIADGTAPGFSAATESLKKVFTTKGQMMNRLGTPRTGPMNVANNFIKPKLKAVAGYTAVQSSIKLKMSTLSSSGRSMSANFTIIANDLDGQPQKYGPYHAFAVFTSCSAVLESLYVSNMLNSQDIQSLVTPAFSILNFLPNKTTTSTQPSLKKLLQAVNSMESLNSTEPLDSLQPRQGQGLKKISQAVFGSWVMKGINSIIQSPQVQTYLYQYTSGCQDSTIGNMQFCSAVSTSGSENLATTPDFESACNYLCADGVWDDVADWACDTGCYAACYGCQSCNEVAGVVGYSCGSCGSSCSYCGCNAQCSDSCEQSLGEIDINYSINVDNFQGAQSTYFNDVEGTIIYGEESQEIPAGPNWYEATITNPIIQPALNGYFTGFNSSVSFKATSDPNTFNLPSLSKTIPIDSANSVIYVSDALWSITHDCSFTFRYPLPGPSPVPMPQRAALQPFVWNVSGSGNLSLSLIKLEVSYGWIPPDLFYDGMSSNTTNSTSGSSFNGTKLWDPTYSEDIDIDLSNNFATRGNTLMNSAVSTTLTNIISKAIAGMDFGSIPCCNYRTDDGNCPTQLPMPPTQPY